MCEQFLALYCKENSAPTNSIFVLHMARYKFYMMMMMMILLVYLLLSTELNFIWGKGEVSEEAMFPHPHLAPPMLIKLGCRCPSCDAALSPGRLRLAGPLVWSRRHPARRQSVRVVPVCHHVRTSTNDIRQFHRERYPTPAVRQRQHTAYLRILSELEVRLRHRGWAAATSPLETDYHFRSS